MANIEIDPSDHYMTKIKLTESIQQKNLPPDSELASHKEIEMSIELDDQERSSPYNPTESL